MNTLTSTPSRIALVVAATLVLCGPVVAAQQDGNHENNPVAQAQYLTQEEGAHWWQKLWNKLSKPEPKAKAPAPSTTTPATTTPSTTTAPTTTTTTTTPPITTGRLIEKTYFGMHIHNADTTTPWPPVTFGYWHLWDSGTAWLDLEPAQGKWNFTRLDKDVALAQEHGVEVGLTLGLTPRWASARPDESCSYGSGCFAEPADIANWENYVRTVAERYRGRIKYYEIWNEPNFSHGTQSVDFFTGSVDKLVELASTAYATIKQVDPGAKIVSPAAVAWVDRVEPFLQAGGGKTFDIFTAHYYILKPEDLTPRVDQFKALLAKYGLQDKPMWNTESGYLISTDSSAPAVVINTSDPFAITLDQQTAGAVAARYLILGAAAGLDRSALYAWDNQSMGFINLANNEITAVGRAYGTVASWMIGSRLQGCVAVNPTFWRCEITRDARRAWIVWNTAGNVEFQTAPLPATVVEAIALNGQSSPVEPGAAVSVGIAPVLLKTDSLPW